MTSTGHHMGGGEECGGWGTSTSHRVLVESEGGGVEGRRYIEQQAEWD